MLVVLLVVVVARRRQRGMAVVVGVVAAVAIVVAAIQMKVVDCHCFSTNPCSYICPQKTVWEEKPGLKCSKKTRICLVMLFVLRSGGSVSESCTALSWPAIACSMASALWNVCVLGVRKGLSCPARTHQKFLRCFGAEFLFVESYLTGSPKA